MNTRRAAVIDGLQECLVDEAIDLYRGEWILMWVTGYDDEGWPAKGHVLVHSSRRADISAVLAKEPRLAELPPDRPQLPYHVFRAFPRARSGAEYERTVRALFAQLPTAEVAPSADRRR